MTEPTPELRPMGIGDLFDATLRLYRQHFATFLLIALTVYLPYAVLEAGFTTAMGAPVAYEAEVGFEESAPADEPAAGEPGTADTGAAEPGTPEAADDPFGEMEEIEFAAADAGMGPFLVMLIGFGLFFMIVFPLCQGAMVHKISAGYLGESIGAAEAYRRALPRLPRLIAANILAGIVIFIGYMLLIVPGVIAMLWLMLLTAVIMLEDKGVVGSMGRSRELMRGNLGKGFLILLVIGAIGLAFGGAMGLAMEPLYAVPFVGAFVTNVMEALILPIQTAPVILFYYDLRIRKEAFDLERLAEALTDHDQQVAAPEA